MNKANKQNRASQKADQVWFCAACHKGLFALLMVIGMEAVAVPKLPEEAMSAITTAIKTHPEVLRADSEMLSARSQVRAGEFRWFPNAEVAVRTGEQGDRYSTMGLNQALWDNGRRNAEFEAAKAGARAAFAGKYSSMQTIGVAAINAYLDVARTRAQLLVAEANVREHEKLHSSVVKRNEGGIGSKSDATLATSRLQQAKATEKHWQGQVARAEASYLATIGANVPARELPGIELPATDDEKDSMLDKVVTRSPSLKKLREEVKVAEANVSAQRALLFPTLFARVDNTKYFGSGPFDNDTRFSVNMQWQNDVALTQRYKIEAAQYGVEAARHALESEQRILLQTASNYWADFIAALKRSEELERFAKSAAETVNLFKRQFTIGRRSWPEVTNTLQDLYSAESQKVEARYAVIASRMALAFMAGEMDELIEAEIDAQRSSYTNNSQ